MKMKQKLPFISSAPPIKMALRLFLKFEIIQLRCCRPEIEQPIESQENITWWGITLWGQHVRWSYSASEVGRNVIFKWKPTSFLENVFLPSFLPSFFASFWASFWGHWDKLGVSMGIRSRRLWEVRGVGLSRVTLSTNHCQQR